jgi:hypothetical protein
LKDLGYVEGTNIIVEYRYANGTDGLAEIAAELVCLKLDVFVADATPAVQAVKNATATAPVTIRELLVSTLAQGDALAKLLIEKGLAICHMNDVWK